MSVPSLEAATLPLLPNVSEARQRLYETAIDLFGTRGYSSVAIKDLTDVLGITPPALYGYVSSKKQLLMELATIGVTLHRDEILDAILGSQPAPQEQLSAIVRAHVLVHLRYPELARIISTEVRHLDPEQVEALTRIREITNQRVLEVVERGVRLGDFAISNLPLTLRMIADLGIRTAEWSDRPDPSEFEAIAEDYVGAALRILCACPLQAVRPS